MGHLIARLRHRVGYVWYWRFRYWWFDKPQGAHARQCALIGSLFLCCMYGVGTIVVAARPHRTHAPQQAIIWFIVWAIVAIVAALAVVLMSNRKPAAPQDAKANSPTNQDGKAARRYYGTFCIQDPAELGWKLVGKDPIYSDGGGK